MTIGTLKIASSEQGREEQVAALPRQLMHYFTEDEGGPGLTLTREHIAALDEYCAHVQAIPSEYQPLVAWLGYSMHYDAEISVDSMHALFSTLRRHATDWPVLRARCLALPGELGACANAIDRAGEQALLACEKTKALGGRREAWHVVQFEAPIELSAADKIIVADLAGLLKVINVEAGKFHEKVVSLYAGIEVFRDVARFDHRPLLGRKIDAIKRTENHPAMVQMRAALDWLDAQLDALNRRYYMLSKYPPNGDALEPQYSEMMRRLREQRDEFRQERLHLSADLAARGGTEGRLQGLATRLDQLITRMQDVTTSAAHLHTAWQLIGVYLETSIERLHTLHNSQQLGIFVIHFKNFLSQWAFIEQCAIALEKRLQ